MFGAQEQGTSRGEHSFLGNDDFLFRSFSGTRRSLGILGNGGDEGVRNPEIRQEILTVWAAADALYSRSPSTHVYNLT